MLCVLLDKLCYPKGNTVQFIGRYISSGTDNQVKVTMEGWDFMRWYCEPEDKDWTGDRTELKYGFGSRYSWSNCIYDNLVEKIKSECECDKLRECNDDTKWKCKQTDDNYN